MDKFTIKKISEGKRVCLRLKETREQAGVSLKDLAKKTAIKESYLEALENCQFEKLPGSAVYHKGFIVRYLKGLRIDPTPFVQQYCLEEDTASPPCQQPLIVKRNYFHNLPLLIRTASIATIIIALLGYLVLQVRQILEPPALTLYNPTNGEITQEKQLDIHGKTDKEVMVMINGKEIFNNQEGIFTETIDLKPGVNTITVSAKRRHGKEAQETRYVTFREPAPQLSLSNDPATARAN